MARQRLGVVLTVPEALASQIDGLRRALGDGALGRVPPHITLVPPVNVPERDVPAALAVVRKAAAECPPLHLRLGPVTTFRPVNPVAYLAVGGEPEQLDALRRLRDGCLTPPLERPLDHEFVPHVTVADELSEDRLAQVADVLADFVVEVTFEHVHVLTQGPTRRWSPIADSPLGVEPGVVGRGSLPVELTVTGRPDLEAATLLAIEGESPGLPFAVTARRDGAVVAAAWGWSAGGRLELADFVVASAHRGAGLGRHLLAAVEDLGRRRGCNRAGAAAPAVGAPAALLRAAGWVLVPEPDGPSGGTPSHRRWERVLATETD